MLYQSFLKTMEQRLIIYLDRKRRGGKAPSVRVEPTLHHCTVSMTILGNADCTAVERCHGRRAGSGVGKYCTMPKAPNRTANDSTVK